MASSTSTNLADNTSSAHYDLLIQEIESVDDYLGPTFRAIYDGGDHEQFMEHLDANIKNHDKDIERMCNFHYQGFIDSIRELQQVKAQAMHLKSEVIDLNEALQNSASNVLNKAEDLVEARRVENNIQVSIEKLTQCLPVFSMYAKLQKQMKDKKYYPALKTLEQLEQIHLPRVSNYRFFQQMKDNIPKLRENIKVASMSDLKDFLENIRKFSSRIGEVAMKHTAEQLNSDAMMIGKKTKKKRPAPAPPNPFTGAVVSSQEEEDDPSAQHLIDFSPVYRCMHIYTVLAVEEEFQSYYRKQRQEQARLVLQPPPNMHESIASYKGYVHSVVGFFVVEDHVLNTTENLISRAYLDQQWEVALGKISNALRTQSAYCTDATLLLHIKDLIMLFITTLRNYGYSVNQLFDLLHEIGDHYNEVLMQRWVQVFRELLEEESFIPIQVETQDQYDDIVELFPFLDESLEASPFPKKFPFSQMVPNVYQQVKEFIYACLKFSEDLNLSQSEVDDMMRKSTNLLLTRTFSGCLSSLFHKPSLALNQIIQIIIDTRYLEDATVYLEQFVSNITGSLLEGQLGSRGEGHLFRVARDDAERQICEKLKAKLDSFLELENYDWLLVEPQGHASSFITDLIAFLQSIFQSFTNIPSSVAKEVCKSACQHIASSLLGFMLSEDVKQISMGALQQINLDTIQCEQFAASDPVPGLEDGVLLGYFSRLRQVLDLLMSWDWPTYFHDYGHEATKYQHVNPNTAIALLEKLREADKKSVFQALKKSERDKKKLLETVLKQLRQLAVTAATAGN